MFFLVIFKLMVDQYSGMTVNERLCVSGLIDEFDKAIEEKNREEAIRVLKEVELTDENIQAILEQSGL